jgi:hypothetical protein
MSKTTTPGVVAANKQLDELAKTVGDAVATPHDLASWVIKTIGKSLDFRAFVTDESVKNIDSILPDLDEESKTDHTRLAMLVLKAFERVLWQLRSKNAYDLISTSIVDFEDSMKKEEEEADAEKIEIDQTDDLAKLRAARPDVDFEALGDTKAVRVLLDAIRTLEAAEHLTEREEKLVDMVKYLAENGATSKKNRKFAQARRIVLEYDLDGAREFFEASEEKTRHEAAAKLVVDAAARLEARKIVRDNEVESAKAAFEKAKAAVDQPESASETLTDKEKATVLDIFKEIDASKRATIQPFLDQEEAVRPARKILDIMTKLDTQLNTTDNPPQPATFKDQPVSMLTVRSVLTAFNKNPTRVIKKTIEFIKKMDTTPLFAQEKADFLKEKTAVSARLWIKKIDQEIKRAMDELYFEAVDA